MEELCKKLSRINKWSLAYLNKSSKVKKDVSENKHHFLVLYSLTTAKQPID